MFLFVQLQKRGNPFNKFTLWSRTAPLFNITEIPIGNPKVLCGIAEVQLGLLTFCANKSAKSHLVYLLPYDGSLHCEHLTYSIIQTNVLFKRQKNIQGEVLKTHNTSPCCHRNLPAIWVISSTHSLGDMILMLPMNLNTHP